MFFPYVSLAVCQFVCTHSKKSMKITSSLRTISDTILTTFNTVCQFVVPTSDRPGTGATVNTDSIQNIPASVRSIALLALHSYTRNHFTVGYKFLSYGVGRQVSRLTTLLLFVLLIAVIRMVVVVPSLFSLSAVSFVLILGFFFGINARILRKTGVGN